MLLKDKNTEEDTVGIKRLYVIDPLCYFEKEEK